MSEEAGGRKIGRGAKGGLRAGGSGDVTRNVGLRKVTKQGWEGGWIEGWREGRRNTGHRATESD